MTKPHVVILGGGPAGVGAAYRLRRLGRASVTLLERQKVFGGNAGSFFSGGQHLDYGSHRLHSACDPEVLADIRQLLDGDLAHRPRKGRIRLRGKWVRFPLRPVDLLLRLDRSFAFGAAVDMFRRNGGREAVEGPTFASVLRANLGPTICEGFYFPYARKIWGEEPEKLSSIQARKRVTAGTFGKLLRRLVRRPGKGRFFYPKEGYGQISDAYAASAAELGATLLTGWSASGLVCPAEAGGKWVVQATDAGGSMREIEADYVWSTIPITLAAKLVIPEAPPAVLAAAAEIRYRAMVLVYLRLDVEQFTTTDAHYFPEADISMTRLSEPKNYFGSEEPEGRTTLCAELPCTLGDDKWNMDDEALGRRVVADMERAGLSLKSPPVSVFSKRLPQAYPIYLAGYEKHLEALDRWMLDLPGFLSYGRQGLFAHDNTHHALYMAYAAVDCTSETGFDRERWSSYREVFATHVVED